MHRTIAENCLRECSEYCRRACVAEQADGDPKRCGGSRCRLIRVQVVHIEWSDQGLGCGHGLRATIV